MPVLRDGEVRSAEAKGLTGVHLYSFSGSLCSRKVRLLLALKGIAYTTHTRWT